MKYKVALLLPFCASIGVADTLAPSGAEIPPAYETLTAFGMISDARVDFDAVTIEQTDGFTVTAPDGSTFIVDNVEKPNCVFIATYVDNSNPDNPIDVSEINSNVNVQEVNFDNCQ